jgi:hypothetical protein
MKLRKFLLPSMEEAARVMSGSILSKQLIQNKSICTFIDGPIMGAFKALQRN